MAALAQPAAGRDGLQAMESFSQKAQVRARLPVACRHLTSSPAAHGIAMAARLAVPHGQHRCGHGFLWPAGT
eukprot:366449-Chlamydomonas_euryale.AAC.12